METLNNCKSFPLYAYIDCRIGAYVCEVLQLSWWAASCWNVEICQSFRWCLFPADLFFSLFHIKSSTYRFDLGFFLYEFLFSLLKAPTIKRKHLSGLWVGEFWACHLYTQPHSTSYLHEALGVCLKYKIMCFNLSLDVLIWLVGSEDKAACWCP